MAAGLLSTDAPIIVLTAVPRRIETQRLSSARHNLLSRETGRRSRHRNAGDTSRRSDRDRIICGARCDPMSSTKPRVSSSVKTSCSTRHTARSHLAARTLCRAAGALLLGHDRVACCPPSDPFSLRTLERPRTGRSCDGTGRRGWNSPHERIGSSGTKCAISTLLRREWTARPA
jgi:hypothetical protein